MALSDKGRVMSTKHRTKVNRGSPLMTVRETQVFLQRSRRITYRVIHSQGFPAIRFGRAIRVPRDALLAWVAAQLGK